MSQSQQNIPPLIKEMSERFKNPLDDIQGLKDMEVLLREPFFPKIVVLGDASTWSVIHTLVGLNLPSGLGIPMVLKFKSDSDHSSMILLEFKCENRYFEKEVSGTVLASEIAELVNPIPEDKRSGIEFTLTLFQPEVSCLTIIVLPEIHTHLDDIKEPCLKERKEIELLDGYIKKYTMESEYMFLNILSSTSNFNSSLSTKVLKQSPYFGKFTITIFTKPELCTEYMVRVLTSKNLKIPFGYLFVNTTIEDGQKTQDCDLLSKVNKDYIGFDVISKNLVTAMLSIVFNPRSLIPKSIESEIEKSKDAMKQLRKTFDSVSDATPTIVSVVFATSSCLHKLFVTQQYIEYLKDQRMHAAYNIERQIQMFRTNLLNLEDGKEEPFLKYEIELLNSRPYWELCLTRIVFGDDIESLLERRFSYASRTINRFVSSIMDYIEWVVVKVLLDRAKNNLQLYQYLKEAGKVLVKRTRESFEKKVEEMVKLEKRVVYTCSDDCIRKVNEMKSLKLELDVGKKFTTVEGFGKCVKVDHLYRYPTVKVEKAFEMRKRLVVYWEFVVNRFVDYCALNLRFLIDEMINDGVETMIEEHLMNSFKDKSKLPDVEHIVALRNADLEGRIEYLLKVKKDIEKWQVEFEFFL